MFKVAFKQYHTLAGPAAQPTLYFKPYGPLFDAASVDACVEGARLVTPGTWSYNVAVGNATAQTGSKVGRAGRIVVPQLPWADNVSCDYTTIIKFLEACVYTCRTAVAWKMHYPGTVAAMVSVRWHPATIWMQSQPTCK